LSYELEILKEMMTGIIDQSKQIGIATQNMNKKMNDNKKSKEENMKNRHEELVKFWSNVRDKSEENQNNLKICFIEGFPVMESNIKARIQGLGSTLMELNKNIKVEMEHNRGEINDDIRNMIEELGMYTNEKFVEQGGNLLK
jgi:hypothetical protein